VEGWTDDEILARWRKVGNDFKQAIEDATPTLIRLSKLEMEIQALKVEIAKRGVLTHGNEENGG
jgi:hypothetical protein